MLNPNSPLYNMIFKFEIKGPVNIEKFKHAFQTLINQHDVLRLKIALENDQPKQVFLETVESDLQYLDFSSESDAADSLNKWIENDKVKLFNPGELLYKTALFKMESGLYIWYINQHHLITDGWSIALLINKLSSYYTSGFEVTGTKSMTGSYSDHAKRLSQKNYIPTSFWNDKKEEITRLPPLYGNKLTQTETRSERYKVQLGKALTSRLKAFCHDDDIRAWTTDLSLYHVFLTTINLLIYKSSGQSALSVGVPSHNRFTPKDKQVAGLFMGLLPIYSKISASDSLLDVFKKTRDQSFEVLKNASNTVLPNELLRSFNVILNFIPQKFSDFAGMPMQSEWIHSGHHDPAHHIRLQIHDFDNQGDYQLLFDLNSQVFEQSLAKRLPDHFIKILTCLIESKDTPVSALSIITEKEKALLSLWNDTSKALPVDETLLTSFEEHAKTSPNKTALVFDDKEMSYGVFDQKANQLANYLIHSGVEAQDIVGVQIDRSFEMMIAIYAILKAGAAYLPIDTQSPFERTKLLLSDAKVKALITQNEALEFNTLVINFNQLKYVISEFPTTRPQTYASPEDIAYIIYTSGSTGQPKGVKCDHRGICNRLSWMNGKYPLDASDVLLQKTPITFDVSVWELFWPLQVGVTLIIEKPEAHKDSTELINTIKKHSVTTIHFVPSMLNAFLNEPKVAECKDLRQVFASGEVLPMATVTKFHASLSAELYNLYGPTEACVDVTAWHCKRGDQSMVVPIGFAVDNTQLHVLDNALQQVPIGTPGELYIAGVQVAKGYLNNETLTRERFVFNPFSEHTASKMYRTGDIVRYREDGALEYLGRQDSQIKLRGFRIELGEIESHLVLHEKVEQAIVTKVDQDENASYLIAYYTGQLLEDAQLKSYLEKHLPDYMIPSFFIKVDAFALNSSGKIDRKQLPAHKLDEVITSDIHQSPESQLEKIIAEVWEDILKVKNPSVNDNFIHLGGDSLKALIITSRLKEMFELDLSVHLIFSHSNIKTYANYVEELILEIMSKEDA